MLNRALRSVLDKCIKKKVCHRQKCPINYPTTFLPSRLKIQNHKFFLLSISIQTNSLVTITNLVKITINISFNTEKY